jgi:dynein heavy chain
MFLKQTNFDDNTVELCVTICKHFHTTVSDSSEMFYREQKRRTYVTPTSYLELIQTFKSFYYLKVEQITTQMTR